jgi:phospholipid/cholesterol/gamma-HCH transport system substrate-binding protein
MRASLRLAACVMTALLVASGCSLIGGGGGRYHLVAYFPRAVSLYKSSQVRVLGLPAGNVDDIEVQGTRVKVTMSIDDDIPVPKNVKALIAPQSLIGERYIQLSPAWRQGLEKAPDGMEITDTIIPVEPDEALAELKKFLDSLDPQGLGNLINNLSDDLKGQGPTLNHALDQVSQVVSTFAQKDEQLADIVDHFDQFTATLTTRENELGDILTTFSQATQVLADERQGLENLLAGLADLSQTGLAIVAKHSAQLKTDLDTLTRVAQSIDVNLDNLGQLLDSGPMLVKGILGAYNAPLRAFNLRQNWGPVAEAVLAPIFSKLGISPPSVCPPVLQECGGIIGLASSKPATVQLPQSTTPVDDLLGLLQSPVVPRSPAPSTADRVGDGASAVGGFLRAAAGAMVGAS